MAGATRSNVIQFPRRSDDRTIPVMVPAATAECDLMTVRLSRIHQAFGLTAGDLLLVNKELTPGECDLCLVERRDGETLILRPREFDQDNELLGVVVAFQRSLVED